MINNSFYKDLESFSDFSSFSDRSHYKRVPEDWSVFIADIAGSTEAIERGDYRQVNTIGAAAITVCLKRLEGEDFPYVFGGDGASLVAPPSMFPTVIKELSSLSSLSMRKFGLKLRVAQVPVKLLNDLGRFVEVGKFELTEGRNVAVFSGGGLALADKLAKEDYENYRLPGSNEDLNEIEGLSCRWNPVPAKRGSILSLIISANREDDIEVYRLVHQKLEAILEGDLSRANPLNLEQMSYKGMWQSIKDESRFHSGLLSIGFLKRVIEIILATLIFKWNVPPIIFDKDSYARSMITHSDSLKFDDNLRLVLDCSSDEVEAIKECLAELRSEGRISYGLHEASEALMTCYVEDLNQGNHLHFVDGGDGGYAVAAKMLKAQIKALIKSEA